MTQVEKILFTIMWIGIVMIFVNAFIGVKFTKIKYHFYSTILFGVAFFTFIIIKIWQ